MPVRAKASSWLRFTVAVIGLGLLALVVHTIFSEGGYLDLRRRRATYEQLQQEVERLEKENRELTGEIQALKEDPAAIERVAREKLKMARPGETVITLPPKDGKKENPTGKTNP